MKKVGGYTLPDNAKLAGIGFSGCYYYNIVGDIYLVHFAATSATNSNSRSIPLKTGFGVCHKSFISFGVWLPP